MTGSQGTSALAKLQESILLVGAGKMGSAMLQGWLTLGVEPRRLVVVEPQPSPEIQALGARGLALNPAPEHVGPVAAVVLAVKPQTAPAVTPSLTQYVARTSVIVSIMAGRSLKFLEAAFPGAAVVRAMPNTPASIGRGITVAVASAHVTDDQRALVHALLAAVGAVEWIRDEPLMDAVTAVSGSGPAYVFLLAECLAQAGIAAGLPTELAQRLACATAAGAGDLLQRSGLPPSQLRENVTSPGGTTAAALEVLMAQNGLAPLMVKAIAAATTRSRELAG
ncbi:MAG: pyrroline-5-carboxylate reductase [Xanthobacteraceae bacterium]